MASCALHLDIFPQPDQKSFFQPDKKQTGSDKFDPQFYPGTGIALVCISLHSSP
jgi:hypothetical protein